MAPMPATTRARRALAAVVVACMVTLGACTDDPDDPSPPGDGPESVALQLSIGPGAADLGTAARDDLQNDVGAVLSTYVVDAFLGDYPRGDFVKALDLFTSGVAQKAATHIEELTGAGFKGADTVVASRLTASISAFAPGREALGASAHVDFAFDVTENGSTREVTVRGRLMLAPVDGRWKIFGFDVATDDPAAGGQP
jgi:hypothetical protein